MPKINKLFNKIAQKLQNMMININLLRKERLFNNLFINSGFENWKLSVYQNMIYY